jgi:PRTRC genetic system ThiF family protein
MSSSRLIEKGRVYVPRETAYLPRSRWRLFLIGCGGTGAHLALALAKMMVAGGAASERIHSLTLVDGDAVEARNIGRQHFIAADIGKNKAEVTALRLSRAFPITVRYISEFFAARLLDPEGAIPPGNLNEPTLILGAVDTPAARAEIFAAVTHKTNHSPRNAVYWLDAGNGDTDGQVVWGNTAAARKVEGQMGAPVFEYAPYPPFAFPNLVAIPQAKPAANCAQDAAAGVQSQNINQFMATMAAEMARQLLEGILDTHFWHINLRPFGAVSQKVTDDYLASMITEMK